MGRTTNILLVLLLTTLASCIAVPIPISVPDRVPFSSESLDFVEPGITTKSEIRKALENWEVVTHEEADCSQESVCVRGDAFFEVATDMEDRGSKESGIDENVCTYWFYADRSSSDRVFRVTAAEVDDVWVVGDQLVGRWELEPDKHPISVYAGAYATRPDLISKLICAGGERSTVEIRSRKSGLAIRMRALADAPRRWSPVQKDVLRNRGSASRRISPGPRSQEAIQLECDDTGMTCYDPADKG